MMKHDCLKLILCAALALTAMIAAAAVVDVGAANKRASSFLSSKASGRFMAVNPEMRLVCAQSSALDAAVADYYVFDTSDGAAFVIVAGDDRMPAVLGYGEGPFDATDLPESLRDLLELYRLQMEYLFEHPELEGKKFTSPYPPRASVAPMLTAQWNQTAPYNDDCPMYEGKRCITGCSCTSTAIEMYYWKFPSGIHETLPSYVTSTKEITVPPLPPASFDWAHMLDIYTEGQYSPTNAAAVSRLMRYVGQAEHMDYTPTASGAYDVDILAAAHLFGYTDAELVEKDDWDDNMVYNDDDWDCMMQDELEAGRPLVYMGFTDMSGHAFNVDGYDAVNNLYHVNYGWGGQNNGYYMLNGFYGYSCNQRMLVWFQPPTDAPVIKPRMSRVIMNCVENATTTSSLSVSGKALTGNVKLTLHDDLGYFSLKTNKLTMIDVLIGATIDVDYSPKFAGTHVATVTLSSTGAPDVTVTLVGTATIETHAPVLLPPRDVSPTSVMAQWQDSTPSRNVQCYDLELIRVPRAQLRLNEAFDKGAYTGSVLSDCSMHLDEITSTPGWTGRQVSYADGCITVGLAANGWLASPPVDLAGAEGLATVNFMARCPEGVGSSLLKVQCGDTEKEITLSPEEMEYKVLFPVGGDATGQVQFKVSRGNKAVLSSVRIYAGDGITPVTDREPVCYEGITQKSHLIEGLDNSDYYLRVMSHYVDGSASPWSEYLCFAMGMNKADVNHDGEVNVADINAVVDEILMKEAAFDAPGDVNGDGEVNIADINAVIDKILEQ